MNTESELINECQLKIQCCSLVNSFDNNKMTRIEMLKINKLILYLHIHFVLFPFHFFSRKQKKIC